MNPLGKTYSARPMRLGEAALTSLLYGATGSLVIALLLFLDQQFTLHARWWHYLAVFGGLMAFSFAAVFWKNHQQIGIEWKITEEGVTIRKNGKVVSDVPFRLLVLVERKREWLERFDHHSVGVIVIHRQRDKGHYSVADYRMILSQSDADPLQVFLEGKIPTDPESETESFPEESN